MHKIAIMTLASIAITKAITNALGVKLLYSFFLPVKDVWSQLMENYSHDENKTYDSGIFFASLTSSITF